MNPRPKYITDHMLVEHKHLKLQPCWFLYGGKGLEGMNALAASSPDGNEKERLRAVGFWCEE